MTGVSRVRVRSVWVGNRRELPRFSCVTQSPPPKPPNVNTTTTTLTTNPMTPIQRRGYRTLLDPFRSIQSIEYRRHSHLRGPRHTPAQRQRLNNTFSTWQPTNTTIPDILQRSTKSILARPRWLTSSGSLWRARRGSCNLSTATHDAVRLRHRSSGRYTPPVPGENPDPYLTLL